MPRSSKIVPEIIYFRDLEFSKTFTMNKLILLFLSMGFVSLVHSQDKLSLEDCRRMALEYDQDVRSAGLNINAAEEETSSARNDLYPKLDGGGWYNYRGRPINPGNAPNNIQHLYNVNAEITQPIYAGGKFRQSYELAKINEELKRAQKDLTDNEIMLDTDISYWYVVSLKEKFQLAKDYREILETLVQDVRNKMDAEIVSRSDLLQAQVRYNDADLMVLQHENALAVSVMTLNRQIGLPIEQPTDVQDSIIVQLYVIDSTNVNDRALSQRPEIMMGESSVDGSKVQIKLTASDYNPYVGVGFKGYYGAPGIDFTQSPDWNYIGSANLSIPIFYGGQRKREVNASKIYSEVAELQLEKTQELVKLDVQQSKFNLFESVKQYELAGGSLNDAEENLDIITDRYNEGLSPIIEVLDAQVYWQLAYLSYIDAKTYYQISYSEFLKALGEYVPKQ